MAIKPVGMRQSAWDYLLKFTETHEGPIRHLYNAKTDEADVTLGIGISLPSETSAMASGIVALCFDPATGLPATAEQMKTDWLTASTHADPWEPAVIQFCHGRIKSVRPEMFDAHDA
jgi:hypothetical protein